MTGLVSPNDVVQFRAVPYATIPARFKKSILLENLNDTNRDFTKPGYACPHVFSNEATSGGEHPDEPEPLSSDEFKCLIVQVNVPLVCFQPGSNLTNLPVAVYIHGGGFHLGKINASHNTALMVQQSVSDSKPLISISMQYRLGALGFMRTPTQETGFGFYDQRNALLWIQKFIGGFGGDKGKITAFGESAGALSICYHMLAAPPPSGPLFQRVILMSGIIGPSTAPMPTAEADKNYLRLLKKLDIAEDSNDAMEQLRKLDVEKIVEASAALTEERTTWFPVEDKDWYGQDVGNVTWDRIPELLSICDWVNDIVLGGTGFEGVMFGALSVLTPKNFRDAIAQQVGEQNAALVMEAYRVTPGMDHNLFLTSAAQWLGDVIFDASTHALATYLSTHTNKRVYRYIFDVRNPFIGSPLYQTTHHWVDVYFVFKTMQFRYPLQKLKDISTRHAQLWNTVTVGEEPWSRYQIKEGHEGKEIIMVADDRDGWVERSMADDEKMNERNWKRREVLWESWKDYWQGKWFAVTEIEPLKGKKMVGD
ncbi:Alpha/Beta hydrolase protein [Massariosphaeria phaeospora]|uniref:Alpha/Beta hydrolase protein n=1 Tax=Massariosphaeria phaeospora TaxID=100035 RepID=A0A7C8MW72_9PLEO|nr:Alpha/Beta hydrolase protein [Massariosphaeria phaeospora]